MNKKLEAYPGVPTFADYGIEGGFEGWSRIFVPKGVPQEVVEKLTAATNKVMKNPKVIKAYQNMGVTIDYRFGEDWIADMKTTYGVMQVAASKIKKCFKKAERVGTRNRMSNQSFACLIFVRDKTF